MKDQYLILDCFVDEPACFGVPPFISPYPRYVYGALIDAGVSAEKISYWTIDKIRETDYSFENIFKAVFLIGGAIVPGKYLGQKIGTITELFKIVNYNKSTLFIAGGPASAMLKNSSHNVYSVTGDIEFYAYSYAKGEEHDACRNYDQLNRWADYGADIVTFHPNFPDVICEIETYRGCPRESHCSFCSEQLHEAGQYREQEAILSEIDKLIINGITRVRIGRQANILSYKTKAETYIKTFPKPEPDEVIPLFNALHERRSSGKLKVLNVDNCNPGTIAYFEKESIDILAAIAEAVTPGDTLPLGVESFDPLVMKTNNLKIDTEQFYRVTRIMNDIGGERVDGIPKLLPGVNLIHGLPGETVDTFKINYEALLYALEHGILLRRINIRTLVPYSGSSIKSATVNSKVSNRYKHFREKIRKEIDAPLLQKVYPFGAVLKEVKWIEKRFDVFYGKQIASYAITVKSRSDKIELGTITDAVVCNHEERSIDGFVPPLSINSAPEKLLESIYGIGKKQAVSIVHDRPFSSSDDISHYMENVPHDIQKHITE
jgi:radical SAM superfamily enzyme with C-terminal helix-hairpin-helix motif